MWMVQVLNVVVGGSLLWMLAQAATMHGPAMWRLVVALPMVVALSVVALLLWEPPSLDNGQNRLWRYHPAGVELNPTHPTGRLLFRVWAAVGVVWLAALDEAARHDFSWLLGV